MADMELVVRCLGEELRERRKALGWTRAQMVAGLTEPINPATLGTYETGIRVVAVDRLDDLCERLGTSAPVVLKAAYFRAKHQPCPHCGEVLTDEE